jgi:hypothetical protein
MSDVAYVKESVSRAMHMFPSQQLAEVAVEHECARNVLPAGDGFADMAISLQEGAMHAEQARDSLAVAHTELHLYLGGAAAHGSPDVESTQREVKDRNTRPVPNAWDRLAALGDELLASGTDPIEAARELHEVLDAFSDQMVDAHRYYAFSELTCNVMKRLRNPQIRQEVVDRAADIIVRRHRDHCYDYGYSDAVAKGMFTDELDEDPLGAAIRPIVSNAFAELPSNIRFLTFVLECHQRIRIGQRYYGGANSRSYYESLRMEEEEVHNIRTFSNAMFSSAVMLFTKAIGGLRLAEGVLIRDVISMEKLKQIGLTQVALNAAWALHVDELQARVVQKYLSTMPDGELYFDRKKVPSTPEYIQHSHFKTPGLHPDRLRCPALHVAHAIPMVLGMVPDIIQKADEGIRTYYVSSARRKH